MLFAFCFGFLLSMIFSDVINDKKKREEQNKFIYKGFQDYSVETLGYNFEIKPSRVASISKSQNCSIENVSKPETAAKIAFYIFESKYGCMFAEKQIPFSVIGLKDKIWKVEGARNGYVYIQKADGKILSISNK